MNITNIVIDRSIRRKNSILNETKNIKESCGIISYKRVINISTDKCRNMNNISGHDIIIRASCLLTNYSISNTDYGKLFHKTIYMCDLDFPGISNVEMISDRLTDVIHNSIITPTYAYSISHIEREDGSFEDFGLTMVDLNVDRFAFNIINFSNKTGDQPIFKELIYKNGWNPKYYTRAECVANGNVFDRSGKIIDFVDDKTSIVYDKKIEKKNVVVRINGEDCKGVHINNKTVKTSMLISEIFSKIIFISVENLEFIYDSRSKSLMINRISLFSKFCKNYNEYCVNEIYDNLIKVMESYKNDINSDFYCVYAMNEHNSMLNICIFETNEELRVSLSNETLFGNFTLTKEMAINNIEYNSNSSSIALIEHFENSDEWNKDRFKLMQNVLTAIDFRKSIDIINATDGLEKYKLIDCGKND